MTRPEPTFAFHFTRAEHLSTIVENGLLSDTVAQERGLLQIEVGVAGIKADRRRRGVPVPPGGVVADYVPFYFAPRSPMMYRISRGGVEGYQDGTSRLIYLVTSTRKLQESGARMIVTDRNAVLQVAEFAAADDGLNRLVDWALMREPMWNNTASDPDRKERRMAELLVHQSVPFESLVGIAARTSLVADEIADVFVSMGITTPKVYVRPRWYF